MLTGCLNCNRDYDPDFQGAICPHESGEKRRDSLPKFPERVEANGPLRMFIALRVLRAWNNGTAGFSGIVVKIINDWIDGKMQGSIPWPDDPFFAEWAAKNGFSKVGSNLGFRFKGVLPRDLIGKS